MSDATDTTSVSPNRLLLLKAKGFGFSSMAGGTGALRFLMADASEPFEELETFRNR